MIRLNHGRSNAIENAKTENTPLLGSTISEFIKIANAGQSKYQLSFVLNGDPGAYAKFRKRHKGIFNHLKNMLYIRRIRSINVQIIFDGANGDSMGHYICVYYKPREKGLFIFDSNFSKEKPLGVMVKNDILLELFPDAKSIIVVKPLTTKNDNTSNGVLTIAYAMALMDGLNPEHMQFAEIDELRAHLVKILQTKKLSQFPFKGQGTLYQQLELFGMVAPWYAAL